MLNEAVAVAAALFYYIVFQLFAVKCSLFANREHKKVGRKYIGREKSCIFAAKTTI
jgi:hypothetical protein